MPCFLLQPVDNYQLTHDQGIVRHFIILYQDIFLPNLLQKAMTSIYFICFIEFSILINSTSRDSLACWLLQSAAIAKLLYKPLCNICRVAISVVS